MDNFLENEDCLETLIFQLTNIWDTEKDPCNSQVNALLDKLNALDYKSSVTLNYKNAESLLSKCYSNILPSQTFLVAKCCHITQNLVEKQGLKLSDDITKLCVEWIEKALKSSADVAFLDILQVTNAIIKANPLYFEKTEAPVLSVLHEEVEKRSSLADPSDIKVWRIKCLHSLAMAVPEEKIPEYVTEFTTILNSHTSSNLMSHGQIWRKILEALDDLCGRSGDWLESHLREIIGIILAAVHLGLQGMTPIYPKQVYPSLTISEEVPGPRIGKPKVNVRGKKISKSRVKPVGWLTKREEKAEEEREINILLESYNPVWATSDSELSDNEGGKSTRLVREQARVRHAALNLLIKLVKVCWCKPLYGYYSTLLGRGGLIYNLQHETSGMPKVAALVAITALLARAKMFLGQAQHNEGEKRPYTSFSSMLSELIYGIHSILGNQLASAPPVLLSVPLLHATSTLLFVTPYHRLKPTLLTNIFKVFQPYIKNKDPTVRVGALHCLAEIATAEPLTSEHLNIIGSGAHSTSQDNNWLVQLCLQNLEEGGKNETLQVGWWQLMRGLCKCHFQRIIPFIGKLEALLLRDLTSWSKFVQRYSTHTLEAFAAHIMVKDDLKEFALELWVKLLEGPLVPVIQSPTIVASDGCSCLANIGPAVYSSLQEDQQILILTLLYGCSYHEEPKVRASAVRCLGLFLLFPQVAQEQFIYDINDIIFKALSDQVTLVRIKAAWGFGNLADVMLENKDKDFVEKMSLIKLLDLSLSLANDNERVRANVLRAVGSLLLLVDKNHLEEPSYRDAVNKLTSFLIKCATAGASMKTRWNACYAMSNVFHNENLHLYSPGWEGNVISGLCNLLVKCNHFKVRSNASVALCAISKREYYRGKYIKVWEGVLDGLENAANMPDFREFKHQDGLLQQLCLTLCHIASQLELEDLVEVEPHLVYRVEELKQHMSQFQLSAPPEKSNHVFLAVNHISQLEKSSSLQNHLRPLQTLIQIFTVNS